ncbi:low molecular weight phosphotyrosine protein phosphatase [Chlamydiales bacterium]|nr:low molecular weight phosphotyrosine protein phosphatase [Chlamydiales bacterium]
MDLGAQPMFSNQDYVSVMFVCLGNICRSPTAEGLLKKMAKEKKVDGRLHVESSGLGTWHIGKPPDPRAIEAAKNRDLHLTSRAQVFKNTDYDQFDIILAADNEVLYTLKYEAPNDEVRKKIHLMTYKSKKHPNYQIPDPYLTIEKDFNHVLDVLEEACDELLNFLFPLK